MEISPRYDGAPVIVLDGPVDDQRETLARQRQRLIASLAALDEAQWLAASRCEAWTAQDVVNHLITTDGFWVASMEAGLRGEPTRMLAGFDPKATPAALADAMRNESPAESLDQLRDASGALCALVQGLDTDGWQRIAEAPPGHLPIRLLAHHALWDGWIHERDIFLPLAIEPDVEPDEVRASLRYAAALGPALAMTTSPDLRGTLVLEPTDGPPIVIEVDGAAQVRDAGNASIADGAVVLRGTEVELLEQLSVRSGAIADVPADRRWLVGGLADVFEVGVA